MSTPADGAPAAGCHVRRRWRLEGEIVGSWGDRALRVDDPGAPPRFYAVAPGSRRLVRYSAGAVQPAGWRRLDSALRAERLVRGFRVRVVEWEDSPLPDDFEDVDLDGRADDAP